MKTKPWNPKLFSAPTPKSDQEYPRGVGEPLWVNLSNGNHIDICDNCGRRKEIFSGGRCKTCFNIRKENGWL